MFGGPDYWLNPRRYRLLRATGVSQPIQVQAIRSGPMGDTAWDVTGQLRQLAVELVRDSKTSDAMAVLASIGAIEMMKTFSGEEMAAPPPHSPDY